MSGVNWALGVPQTNPGEAFTSAFEKGMAARKQAAVEAAMGALAGNPDDPNALANLAKVDPRSAMQYRGEMERRQAAKLEAHRDNIMRGAQVIRQLQPGDDASWQQALETARGIGIDVSQVPQHFDPQYVKGLMGVADAFAPQKGNDAPTSYEEYQRAQSDPNYAKFLEEKRGPIVANNGDGTFTIIPRSQAAPNPAPQQPGAVPPPPPGFVVDGGPTPPASGPFPAQGH
jgi:hypothetical protein